MKTIRKIQGPRFLFILGTRPEAIKLAPLIIKLKEIGNVKVCVTAQHREMLDQVLSFFSIVPNYDLNVMEKNQSLFSVTAKSLNLLEEVIDKSKPDLIIVQGDTTTALTGALAGFYKGVKVAHIEAGLRSFNKFSPFPEEMNRVLIGHLSDYHFAPTQNAKKNLLKEGVPEENVYVVGNTVIDTLFMTLDIVKKREKKLNKFFKFIDFSKKVILVTGHRRESFGAPFENICLAIKEVAKEDVEIVYPVHLNPFVKRPVYKILNGIKNVHLIPPLDYPHLVFLMSKCYLILTDSGGIQEEAPSLGKPVLVMREVTERTEGIKKETAMLVGTDREKIVQVVRLLLSDKVRYTKMAQQRNPYGDGKASLRIRDILQRLLKPI